MKTEYNLNILQSVESDKEILDKEWKSLKWNSIKYGIFKIQKRIFKAEKEGDYRKVNRLCRLLLNEEYEDYIINHRNRTPFECLYG